MTEAPDASLPKETTPEEEGWLQKPHFLMHLLNSTQSELSELRRQAQKAILTGGYDVWVEVMINGNVMQVKAKDLRKSINSIRMKIGYN